MSNLYSNLTKEVKNLHTENYRKLMKETEDMKKMKKTFHAHGLEEQILLKCLYYPKQSRHLKLSLSKYHQHFSEPEQS